MRKNVKVLLASLLSATLLLSAATAGCSNKKSSLTFDKFCDKTVEVGLGERYMMEIAPVQGSDGNYYTVVASVKDAAGNEVVPFGATVLIDSLQGYTVTYAIMNGEKTLKTVTVKLDVKNKMQPNIVLEKVKNVYAIGEEFKLPKAEVFDISGESLTAQMEILDEDGKPITHDSDKGVFKCERAGSYTLRATATNGGGVTGETSFPFAVEAFNQKLFVASEKTLTNIDNGRTLKNKLLDKDALAALNLKGLYNGETALQLEYINQTPYTLKGVNAWFADEEISKRKYFTVNMAFLKDESLIIPENSSFSFHSGAETGVLSNMLLNYSNGFGVNVIFKEGKYEFNTWYQFTLPAATFAEYLKLYGEVKLFGIYEEKLHPDNVPSDFPKDFRDQCKIIIGDIEVYDKLVYDSNGDNFVKEDYFS